MALAWIKTLSQGLAPPDPIEAQELLLDTLMVGLRLAEGLAIAPLIEQFGLDLIQQVWNCLKRYISVGWVSAIGPNGESLSDSAQLLDINSIGLTVPEGFLFSNVVLVQLFDQLG
jgi:coproporphyrinogen III oxidase-like Fe-S oxidoreductase